MIISKKVRILSTNEEELLFRKASGTARFIWNLYLKQLEKFYEKTGKYLKAGTFRKRITMLKKHPNYSWLKEVSTNVPKIACKDLEKAYKRFFKKISERPKFKKKGVKESFYVNYESLNYKNKTINVEKIGRVKLAETLPKDTKLLNSRITFDGKYWYFSCSYEIETKEEELNENSIGIDLGIKNLAIISTGKEYKNINKSKKVRKLKKKLKRKQRKLSRKLKNNTLKKINNKPVYIKKISELSNVNKTKTEIKLLYRKLNNIRLDYIHQITSEMVKTKPSKIVMEDLKITNLMKNKHLSKSIQECKWYEFKKQIEYKCKKFGIKFVKANKSFPSSKMCSNCGNIKQDLRLKDRVYECECCGLKIDRDYNASMNLMNYKQ